MPTYYIKNSGNDTNTGLSDAQAWTFTKLETFTPANGDTILFNRGEVFLGSLTLRKSGINGAGITYGAYGTGANPIISSLKTLTGWVNHSGNIWKVAAGIPANCGIVTLNDAPVEKGHWPASGFGVWNASTFNLRYISSAANYSGTVAGTTSFVTSAAHGLSNGTMITIQGTTSYDGYYSVTVINTTSFYITATYVSSQTGTLTFNTTITDTDLPASPNFTGADLVLYKSNWTIDVSEIKNHAGTVLTYASGSPWDMQTSGGQKYLIQNSIHTLTYHGAWFCDGSFFYMYLDTNPSNYVIKAGSTDFTISLDRKNYNVVQDLEIQGGNLYAHYCLSSTYHQLLRCTIKNTGLTGVTVITNAVTGASTNTKISECNISKTGGTGIWLNSAGSSIDNNIIDHCGDFAGMGAPGGGSHYGIYSKGVSNIVERNRITNTGYIPIYWESDNAHTRNNFVANYPTLGLNDGGGIYTFASVTNVGMKCYNNILMDSTANGLYSDGAANHVEFYGNTVINVDKWGIHMNEPVGNSVHDNTFYDCGLAAIDITNQYYNGVVASANDVYNNIVVQSISTQVVVSLQDQNTNNAILNLGTMNNNTFIVAETATDIFFNQKGSGTSLPFSAIYRNFTDWKTFTGKEADSDLITKDLSKISVEYNDTHVEKVIPLASAKTDLLGTLYESSITLQPFTSIVLEDTPVAPEPEFEFSLLTDTYGKFLVDSMGNYLGKSVAIVSQLWLAYKDRVLLDTGTIKNETLTEKYFKLLANNNIPEPVVCLIAESGVKPRVVTPIQQFATKVYSLFTPVARYGPELVVNGGFDTDANWTKGVGVTISNGVAVFNNVASGSDALYQGIIGFDLFNFVRVVFTITEITSGGVLPHKGAQSPVNTTPASTIGTFSYIIPKNASGNLIFKPTSNGTTCKIDNISCVEVLNSLDGSPTDATQTTAASQPYLRIPAAPNERASFQNPNGDSRYMTHPTVSFGSGDAWTVQFVIDFSGNSSAIYNRVLGNNDYTINLYRPVGTNNLFIHIDQGTSPYAYVTFISKSITDIIGKTVTLTIARQSNGQTSVYINGILLETKAVSFEMSFSSIIRTNAYPTPCKIYSVVNTPAALTPTQIALTSNFWSTYYPEIPTVTIGSQQWATSNFEAVATPQGNLIANVTENVNVEKITNGEFTGGSTGWNLSAGVTYGTDNLVCTNAGGTTYQTPSIVNSKWYKHTVVVSSYTSGSFTQYVGGVASPAVSSNGTHVRYLQTTAVNTLLGLSFSGTFNGIIESVSIQEIGWVGSQELYDAIYAQTAEAASAIEKITVAADRDFSSDTGWWIKTGVSIASGVCSWNNVLSANIIKGAILTVGKLYRVSGTVSNYSQGTLSFRDGNTTTDLISSNGTFSKIIQATGADCRFAGYITSTFDLDNVSVKELGLSDATSIANYTYAAVKAAGFWSYYNNDSALGAAYGKLYNWYAAKLLQMDIDYYNAANPTTPWGYLLSTNTDWDTCVATLGGSAVAGGKMKVVGNNYFTNNIGADNSSGLSLIGVGHRSPSGNFTQLNSGDNLYWAFNNTGGYYFKVSASSTAIAINGYDNKAGQAIRLIKQ